MALTPNKEQQKAIDILDGAVMLLAGPGTGKTFTVIQRIERMLEKGIEPSSILCLTFSDAAATCPVRKTTQYFSTQPPITQ